MAVKTPTTTATSSPLCPSLNRMAVNPMARTDVGNTILMVNEYLMGLSGKIGILKNSPTIMADIIANM